ncbi:MAG: nuclear transport factor 2 family protein [Thaumarchaeota archaeon]|nr:nuclear transport factor 2 family protein [Nitrososphaerota archaeon]
MQPIKPPFTDETAITKVKMAENLWNTCDPEKVVLAYTEDSEWRDRTEFFKGRKAIIEFLKQKWSREKDYRLMKELWSYTENHISVRFEYEWRHDETGQWYRTHGNELWEFNDDGLMTRRDMSANDISILENDRRIRI